MKPVGVCVIIDNLKVGGAQVHLTRLVNHLDPRRFRVSLVCLGEQGGLEENIPPHITVHVVPMHSIRQPGFMSGFLSLVRCLRMERPDIVHTYLNTANVFGALAARIARVPVVIASRRDMGHFRGEGVVYLEYLANQLIADRIICVSNAVRKHVIRFDRIWPEKLQVIHNGVDGDPVPARFPGPHTGELRVAVVAAMDREIKGHRHFIEAGVQVASHRNDIRFLLFGGGPLLPEYRAAADAGGAKDVFRFEGMKKDVVAALEEVDVLVCPSLSEGFSNAVLEAMSMGIPVIATAVEGNLEVVRDGENGILVPPADAGAIARAVERLADEPELRRAMGYAARKTVTERFSLKKMVSAFESTYLSLVETA